MSEGIAVQAAFRFEQYLKGGEESGIFVSCGRT